MISKIAIEEHFAVPEAFAYLEAVERRISPPRVARVRTLLPRLADLGNERVELLRASGIELAVLSLTGPGAQAEADVAKAEAFARKMNDYLAREVATHNGIYAGFAHLSLHDGDVAARELERCVRELGFVGCMVNGHTLGVYLDDKRYEGFWATAARLGAPVYLHPSYSMTLPDYASALPELSGALWGWAAETGGHALRLILGGTFDRHPDARLILGHMGESLPFMLERLDIGWQKLAPEQRPKHLVSHYLRKNLWITPSGVPSTPALQCSLASLGAERVLFATDYPFEDCARACKWFDDADIPEAMKRAVAFGNFEAAFPLMDRALFAV